jgi:GGDEF domain-containing protein
VTPERYLPSRVFNVQLVLMTACITALAYSGGQERGDLTILFTFVVVFAAYFLSWQTSVVHLGLIVLVLGSRLFAFDADEATRVETIRFSILTPALASVWGLVSLLRKTLTEREARLRVLEIYDTATGVLGINGLDQTLDVELARARRHARPLSLVELEVSGPAFRDADAETRSRVATAVARAIIARIRAEDRAARLADLKFAVLAAETDGSGAAVLARSLAHQVRKRLLSLGYEAQDFCVSVGWSDYQRTDGSKEGLLGETSRTLGGAVPLGDGTAVPLESQPPPTPISDLQPAG